jgi:hypothetical protein
MYLSMATSSTWGSGTLPVLVLHLYLHSCNYSTYPEPEDCSVSFSPRARGLQQVEATELQGRRLVRAGFLLDQQGEL